MTNDASETQINADPAEMFDGLKEGLKLSMADHNITAPVSRDGQDWQHFVGTVRDGLAEAFGTRFNRDHPKWDALAEQVADAAVAELDDSTPTQ